MWQAAWLSVMTWVLEQINQVRKAIDREVEFVENLVATIQRSWRK